jgi:hypothetical protein
MGMGMAWAMGSPLFVLKLKLYCVERRARARQRSYPMHFALRIEIETAKNRK